MIFFFFKFDEIIAIPVEVYIAIKCIESACMLKFLVSQTPLINFIKSESIRLVQIISAIKRLLTMAAFPYLWGWFNPLYAEFVCDNKNI